MTDFDNVEIWEDYWCFRPKNQIDFPILKALNYYSWFRKPKEKIEIRLENWENLDTPSMLQIETLKFIKDRQGDIISNIYEYYRNVILPVYKEAIDIEDDEIANSINELNIVLGIKTIEIPYLSNLNNYYFAVEFDFKYDDEHGLYILFKNESPIDFFGIGDKSYEAISFYEKGIVSKNGELLKFNLYYLNGQTIFQKKVYFEEDIEFELIKGTYRAFVGAYDRSDKCINFYVPNDLTKFTMKQILTN